MNRTIALFLALAILLAHALALHTDALGSLAPPYDVAHVAFRLARNLAQTGSLLWDPGLPAAESYPSILWVGVAAVAERLYLPPNSICQTTCTVAALSTILVVARFSPGRLAGVIAPLLLVVSGGMAASATSGTETALFTLLVTSSFLAYEKRWRTALGGCLALLCLTRPEGALLTLAFLVLEVLRRLRRGRAGASPTVFRSFLAPLLTCAAISAARYSYTGYLVSPTTEALLSGDGSGWARGLPRVYDFLTGAGGPMLVVFPLWYLVRGTLTGTGRRALFLSIAWAAIVAAGGGQALPFSGAMVPTLPILYVAVQEAMTLALDSRRRAYPAITRTLFFLGLAASALASKYPGDLAFLRIEGLHRWWMRPTAQPRFGYNDNLGRLGLVEEIGRTLALRSVGNFLRGAGIDPNHSILTPWPGSVGYLSRLQVIDVLGRATPAPERPRARTWSGAPRADVAQALARRPEYIIPSIAFGNIAPTAQEIAAAWVQELDRFPDDPKRSLAIREELLSTYEMLAVPISVQGLSRSQARRTFFLMRRRDLGLAPRLSVELEEGVFHVDVQHDSHEQLADLRVQLRDREGILWSLRPTGVFDGNSNLLARSSLLIHPTGQRSIRLLSSAIPEELRGGELRVILRNPGAAGRSLFANACEEVNVSLP